jgi:hypothetical protein
MFALDVIIKWAFKDLYLKKVFLGILSYGVVTVCQMLMFSCLANFYSGYLVR